MNRRSFLATAPFGAAALRVRALGQTQPTRRDPAKASILAVSAHPADFCSRAGGTLIKHVRAGSKVKVIWLSHGETNESGLLYRQRPGISIDEVRRIKEKEAFECAAVIGAEGRMLGFGDNPLRMTQDRMDMLAKEIAAFKPNIILTHFKDEKTYPTHWMTAQSVLQAAQIANGSWDIRFFEPQLGSATRVGFVPDHYVEITDVFDQKVEALKKLPSQPELVDRYTVCSRWRGFEAGLRPYAEAFVHWAPEPGIQGLLSG